MAHRRALQDLVRAVDWLKLDPELLVMVALWATPRAERPTRLRFWIDDPKHPQYNKHVVVDPKRVPEWFEKQKMRHGDFAYRWLIEVRHNADPPKPGAGSAIFFHTRRGPDRKTAGCTTMASADLIRVMQWLREDKRPQYTLLPKTEYAKRKKAWGLP